jgi:hypothetical protein
LPLLFFGGDNNHPLCIRVVLKYPPSKTIGSII